MKLLSDGQKYFELKEDVTQRHTDIYVRRREEVERRREGGIKRRMRRERRTGLQSAQSVLTDARNTFEWCQCIHRDDPRTD